MAASLTLTFNDPQTIALLLQYSRFLHEEGIEGTLQEAAAGLVVGSLDENHRFNSWAKANKPEPAAAVKLHNVTPLPAPKVAAVRGTGLLRATA